MPAASPGRFFVPKRVLAILVVLSVFLVTAPQVQAAAKLIAQKTGKTTGGVYISLRLVAGHQYRVDVGAPKHYPFSGLGGENYTYVSNQHLFQTTKPFQVSGTTPKSFTVRQRINGHVTGWILFMDVSVARGKTVTVRVFDMGTR
jgi:hypothetical protein